MYRYQQQWQPRITKTQEFIVESMKRGTFERLGDRSQPLDLPPGVSLEQFIEELGRIWISQRLGGF